MPWRKQVISEMIGIFLTSTKHNGVMEYLEEREGSDYGVHVGSNDFYTPSHYHHRDLSIS